MVGPAVYAPSSVGRILSSGGSELTERKPYLIGIAGPSCAGKSELSRTLARILDAPVLSLDSYYREMGHLPLEQRCRSNFDIPDALDSELLFEHVSALAEGREIPKPVYDFTCHTRADAIEWMHAAEFAIVEGLFALYRPEIRALYGTSVYVTVPDELCLERRIYRDVRERGRTTESVLSQYRETVHPMAVQYIFPTERFADLVVSGIQPLATSAGTVLADIERKLAHQSPALAQAYEVLAG